MEITNKILDDCRQRFEGGQADEALITHLCQLGFSKVETIKVFVDLNRASPLEAKRLVHLSSAWKSAYQRDEKFHDQLERLVNEELPKSDDFRGS